MTPLQQLEAARGHLREWQEALSQARRGVHRFHSVETCERGVCQMLDRLWDAQTRIERAHAIELALKRSSVDVEMRAAVYMLSEEAFK